MNFLPMKNYVENEINNKINNENPHKIILEILIDLKKNLKILSSCFENKESVSEAKSKSFSKSLTAIYILQSSLDFEKGGEIAVNLNQLYESCRINIIKSFTQKNPDLIKKIIKIVDEILSAWNSINKS